MKPLHVSIDQAGRIVLPKDIRHDLDIKAGDTFKISVQGVIVTLTPNKEPRGLIRKGKALVFSTGGDESLNEETVRDVLEAGREEGVSRLKPLFSKRARKS